MKDWRKTVIDPDATLRDAMTSLEHSRTQIVLVLDRQDRLAGVVTDGDIRRAVLRGVQLDDPIRSCMNGHPTALPAGTPRWRLLNRMREGRVHHLPLVGEAEQVVDLVSLDELAGSVRLPNPVVLMAGGLGKRLEALTQDCPKPMLRVGSKPILESILESLVDQGFRNFYVAVHYRGDVIREHFGDGSEWGVQVEYLQEDERLGTAGALSLLPSLPDVPIVVMNGDILTRVDVQAILEFHVRERAVATMAVREYEHEVPYGVVQMNGHTVAGIVEKPVHQYMVNAGIYVLSPEAVAGVPRGTCLDMPALFERLIRSGRVTAAYPIRDYWVDVGRIEELEKARREWPQQ